MVLDGAAPLRARPMSDLLDALGGARRRRRAARASPVTSRCSSTRRASPAARCRSAATSAASSCPACCCRRRACATGCASRSTTELVSVPYVEMTLAVMTAFGATHHSEVGEDGRRIITVAPGRYRAVERYVVEPDASAASYFFAAAAICGGRCASRASARPRCRATSRSSTRSSRWARRSNAAADHITVTGGGTLRGVDVDFTDLSDTAQTLAVVAPFAIVADHDHRHRLHPRQGDRPHRRGRHRAASLRDPRRGAARRDPRASGDAPAGHGVDLRRPPHGHELRPARAASARASPSPTPDVSPRPSRATGPPWRTCARPGAS